MSPSGFLNALRLRLPVRLKLAIVSAALTFFILLLFAIVVGTVAERRVSGSFDNELRATAADLQQIAQRQGGEVFDTLKKRVQSSSRVFDSTNLPCCSCDV